MPINDDLSRRWVLSIVLEARQTRILPKEYHMNSGRRRMSTAGGVTPERQIKANTRQSRNAKETAIPQKEDQSVEGGGTTSTAQLKVPAEPSGDSRNIWV